MGYIRKSAIGSQRVIRAQRADIMGRVSPSGAGVSEGWVTRAELSFIPWAVCRRQVQECLRDG